MQNIPPPKQRTNICCKVLLEGVQLQQEIVDIHTVVWGKKVQKQLAEIPQIIAKKFYAWVTAVRIAGIRSIRVRPGFHDEPLKGSRKGQRSVRLNQAWRAIYVERHDGSLELIQVIEVTHHEY